MKLCMSRYSHKVCLMQNLLSFFRRYDLTKFPSEEGNKPSDSDIYFRKIGFNFKKVFTSIMVFLDPKLTPPCQFQQFSSRGKFFHFQNSWDITMRKEQHQPSWLINFSEQSWTCFKDKNWKSQALGKRFLNGSCELGHPGLWTPPPPKGLIGLSKINNYQDHELMPRMVFLDPKLTPPCQFQQFSSRGKFCHFQNSWDITMRKEQHQPSWLINFAEQSWTCFEDKNWKSQALGIIK